MQLRARAGAINKAITVAEIAKRALPGVRQATKAALEVHDSEASIQGNRYERARAPVRTEPACTLHVLTGRSPLPPRVSSCVLQQATKAHYLHHADG